MTVNSWPLRSDLSHGAIISGASLCPRKITTAANVASIRLTFSSHEIAPPTK